MYSFFSPRFETVPRIGHTFSKINCRITAAMRPTALPQAQAISEDMIAEEIEAYRAGIVIDTNISNLRDFV